LIVKQLNEADFEGERAVYDIASCDDEDDDCILPVKACIRVSPPELTGAYREGLPIRLSIIAGGLENVCEKLQTRMIHSFVYSLSYLELS